MKNTPCAPTPRPGQGDTVILFVHGYNNSYQEAVFRLASLTAEAAQSAETAAGPLRNVRQKGAFVLDGAGRLLTAVAQ
ncbi:alpha/beta hydrolase [Paracoccus xiamenensis]|uniref:alpha/beta hydrolase n=1 Tax=Paracoccus xiamenensis TaxID=2714901 RepID=UPI0014089BD4|nr:alpha/beta hydrolase [Paracoccus xiamenensis]NHF74397.1 alpha/beta hydrolase [Paracoccus xiamenensis]